MSGVLFLSNCCFPDTFLMLNGGMKDWSYRGIELLLNFEYCPFRISLMDQMLEFPDFSESGSTAAGSAGAGHSLMRILAVYCYVLCHPTIDLIMNTSSPPPDFFTHEEAACPHCPLQHEWGIKSVSLITSGECWQNRQFNWGGNVFFCEYWVQSCCVFSNLWQSHCSCRIKKTNRAIKHVTKIKYK